jgi:hypothetical protein
MSNSNSSAVMTANLMLYAEYIKAAKHLYWMYSDGIPLTIDYQDIAHDVMAYANFEPLTIALFSYRFKIQLKKAKMQWFLYQKRMEEYYEYESTPMPDLNYTDFPCGASTKDCIEFLYSKLQRPMTVAEVVSIMRNDDYTRRFQDIETGVKMQLERMNPIYRKKHLAKSKGVSGLKNGKAVMTPEKQSEAKRLFDLWGKKYTAIGREIGVAKSTVANFILGHSYAGSV